MARRERSPEDIKAIKVATEIADEVHASPEARTVGVIIGARSFKAGLRENAPELERLAYENTALARGLASAEARSQGWTPAECSYIRTITYYGMSEQEAAEHMGVDVTAIRQAIRLAKDSGVRLAGDRSAKTPGRHLDTE